MKGINLKGLDMNKFVGTGYNPSQDTTSERTKNGEIKRLTSSKEQVVKEPKERPEVYY